MPSQLNQIWESIWDKRVEKIDKRRQKEINVGQKTREKRKE